jgi:hypothetical protein
VVDKTDIVGLTRESNELVASKVVVVVDHCISKATDDGLGDVYNTEKSVRNVDRSRVLGSPLFFGWVDLE